GTWIGQTFGWQATFLIVAILGIIALIGSALLVPSNLKQPPATKLSSQVKVLTQPRLLLVYAITALGYGGTFTAFTYLAPILEEVSGFG
ncbi:MFS transporter, partial [Vibrio parahaemolyticus]|nr:MFS transporter [Vibrio parahaemolyticus]